MRWMQIVGFIVMLGLFGQSVVSAAAPQSAVPSSSTMKVSFYSKSLQKNMRLNVYLPPNYDRKHNYPVLYVLHAYKLNEDHWFNDLQITQKADEMIEKSSIKPLIIVAPEMDNSFGVNSSVQPGYQAGSGNPGDDGVLTTGMYEDYVTKDVVPYVDSHFNSIRSSNSRYIGGTSMGGFAALHIGLRHPALFGKVGGHSPAIFDGPMWEPLEKMLYPSETIRQANDPLILAATSKLNHVQIYVDMGDQDDFKDAVRKLDGILSKAKTQSYQFHVTQGAHHDNAYWSSQIENYLTFYAGAK